MNQLPLNGSHAFRQYCPQPQQQTWNQRCPFRSHVGQPTPRYFDGANLQNNNPPQGRVGVTSAQPQKIWQRTLYMPQSQDPGQTNAVQVFTMHGSCNRTPQVPPPQFRPKAQWIQNGDFKMPPEFSNAHTVVVKMSGSSTSPQTVCDNYGNCNPTYPPTKAQQQQPSFLQQKPQQPRFSFPKQYKQQHPHASFSHSNEQKMQFVLSQQNENPYNLHINENITPGPQAYNKLNASQFSAPVSPHIDWTLAGRSQGPKQEENNYNNVSTAIPVNFYRNNSRQMQIFPASIATQSKQSHVSRRDKFKALKRCRAANQSLSRNEVHNAAVDSSNQTCIKQAWWSQTSEDTGIIQNREVQGQTSDKCVLVAAKTRSCQFPSRCTSKSRKSMKSVGTSHIRMHCQSISVQTADQDFQAKSEPTVVYPESSPSTEVAGGGCYSEKLKTVDSQDKHEAKHRIEQKLSHSSFVTSCNCGVGPAVDTQEAEGSCASYGRDIVINDCQTTESKDHHVTLEEISKSSLRIGATGTKSSDPLNTCSATDEILAGIMKHQSDSTIAVNTKRHRWKSRCLRRFRSRSPGRHHLPGRSNYQWQIPEAAGFGKHCTSSEDLKYMNGLNGFCNEQEYAIYTCVQLQTGCGTSRQACPSLCSRQTLPSQCTPSGCNTGCAATCVSDISDAMCKNVCGAPTFYLRPISCQPTCCREPCCNVSCCCPSNYCCNQPCCISPPMAPCCDPCGPPLPPRPCTMTLPTPPIPPSNRATCNDGHPSCCSPNTCRPRCRSCSPCSGLDDEQSILASSRTCRSCSPSCSACPPADKPSKPDCVLPCPPQYLPCCPRRCPKPPRGDPCPPPRPPRCCCRPCCPSTRVPRSPSTPGPSQSRSPSRSPQPCCISSGCSTISPSPCCSPAQGGSPCSPSCQPSGPSMPCCAPRPPNRSCYPSCPPKCYPVCSDLRPPCPPRLPPPPGPKPKSIPCSYVFSDTGCDRDRDCTPVCDRSSSPVAPPRPPPCVPIRRKGGNGSGEPPRKKRKRRNCCKGDVGLPIVHTVVKHVPCCCYQIGELPRCCPCYNTCC